MTNDDVILLFGASTRASVAYLRNFASRRRLSVRGVFPSAASSFEDLQGRELWGRAVGE